MKHLIICLIAFLINLIGHPSYSQYENYFNINNIAFKDFEYPSAKPDELKFSEDEKTLIAVFNNLNGFRLLKIDCDSKTPIFDKVFPIKNLAFYRFSPNKKQMLIERARIRQLIYIPNVEIPEKFYTIDVAYRYSFDWIDEENIFLDDQVFNLKSWNFNNNITKAMGKKMLDDRDQYFKSNYNKNFQLFFKNTFSRIRNGVHETGSGLWIQSVNDPSSERVLFYDDNNECANAIVSLNSKRVAYYFKSRIIIRTAYLVKKDYKYVCIDISNLNTEEFQSRKSYLIQNINQECYVEADVYAARIHPVSGEVIEGGTNLKGKVQIVGYEGNTLIGRIISTVNNNDNINGNDFIKVIRTLSYGTINGDQGADGRQRGWVNPKYLNYHQGISINLNNRINSCVKANSLLKKETRVTESTNSTLGNNKGHYNNELPGATYLSSQNVYYKSNKINVVEVYVVDGQDRQLTDLNVKVGTPIYIHIFFTGLRKNITGKYQYTYSQYLENSDGKVEASSGDINEESKIAGVLLNIGGGLNSIPSNISHKEVYLSFRIKDRNSDGLTVGVLKFRVVR